MAAGIERLTDRQIKNTKKDLNDGGNLWLLRRSSGKVWAFRYMIAGKSRKAGLGSYPKVSLSSARKKAKQYRDWLQDGLDPIDEVNRLEKEKRRVVPTFKEAATTFIEKQKPEWKSEKHAKQWTATIETYANLVIGSKPVDQITKDDMLAILQPIWLEKTETAKRIQGRIENILDWCHVMEYTTAANPARWRGHLNKLLQKPTKVKKLNNNGEEKHHLAMPYPDLPAFYDLLQKKNSISAKALQFLILTACRSGEVLNATWDEVDFDNRSWTIPAGRMKGGSAHRVPLTDVTIEILQSLQENRLNEFVFPSRKQDASLSGMAMLVMIRKMGYVKGGKFPAYVPHGFRSSFRDWCEEQSSFPHGVIERALAHTIPNATERAYNRGDLFEKRRLLMEAWGDFIEPNNSDHKLKRDN